MLEKTGTKKGRAPGEEVNALQDRHAGTRAGRFLSDRRKYGIICKLLRIRLFHIGHLAENVLLKGAALQKASLSAFYHTS